MSNKIETYAIYNEVFDGYDFNINHDRTQCVTGTAAEVKKYVETLNEPIRAKIIASLIYSMEREQKNLDRYQKDFDYYSQFTQDGIAMVGVDLEKLKVNIANHTHNIINVYQKRLEKMNSTLFEDLCLDVYNDERYRSEKLKVTKL